MHDIKLSEILRALVFNCTEMKTTTKRTSVSQVGECETKWIERGRATEAFMLRLRKKKIVLSNIVFFARHPVMCHIWQKAVPFSIHQLR